MLSGKCAIRGCPAALKLVIFAPRSTGFLIRTPCSGRASNGACYWKVASDQSFTVDFGFTGLRERYTLVADVALNLDGTGRRLSVSVVHCLLFVDLPQYVMDGGDTGDALFLAANFQAFPFVFYLGGFGGGCLQRGCQLGYTPLVLQATQWYRLAYVVDLTVEPPIFNIYANVRLFAVCSLQFSTLTQG